jgi:hypothetical protein
MSSVPGTMSDLRRTAEPLRGLTARRAAAQANLSERPSEAVLV